MGCCSNAKSNGTVDYNKKLFKKIKEYFYEIQIIIISLGMSPESISGDMKHVRGSSRRGFGGG